MMLAMILMQSAMPVQPPKTSSTGRIRKRLTIHPEHAGAVGRTEKKGASPMTSPSLAEARTVISAAEKRAEEIGQPMNIAVVDAGGNLISHVRMDGAWIGSIDISINKAYTARAFDIATKDLGDNAQPGNQFYGIHASNQGKIMIF